MYVPMLGGYLGFMIIIGFGYETVLKDPTQFTFFFFHIFKTWVGFQKFAKNIISPKFQSVNYHICDINQFSKLIITYLLLQIFISKIIFNVKK